MDSRILVLTIFFCLPSLSVCGESYYLNLTVGMRCELGVPTCGELIFYEVDPWSRHDYIVGRNACIPLTVGPDSFYEVPFEITKLPGDFSPNYEFTLVITHNCTKTGDIWCYKHWRPNLEMSTNVNISLHPWATLSDKYVQFGNDEGECWHPAIPK